MGVKCDSFQRSFGLVKFQSSSGCISKIARVAALFDKLEVIWRSDVIHFRLSQLSRQSNVVRVSRVALSRRAESQNINVTGAPWHGIPICPQILMLYPGWADRIG